LTPAFSTPPRYPDIQLIDAPRSHSSIRAGCGRAAGRHAAQGDPHAGAGELKGIAGTFTIRIEGGQHFYDFDYTLQ
jgi:Protein of unknown function (DUF3224)